MIKAILFDFDGVIVDSYEHNYQSQKKKFEGISREDHKTFFEGNIYELRGKLIKEGKLKENTNIDLHLLLSEHLLTKQIIEKDVLKVLKKLKEKYLLIIISSYSEKYINAFFKKHNLSNLFDEILGLETHKKKDFKFNLVFDKYKINKDESIFITDTLGDIKEANKVGIKTIAVDFGFHERERLEKGNPYKIISKFEDIKIIINKLEIKT